MSNGAEGYRDQSERPTFADIELDNLSRWEGVNVRTREITAGVDDLAANMAIYGQQQPIVVQEKDGRHLILIGQRRYLAAKKLGWKTLNARVVKGLTPIGAQIWSLSENALRQPLTPSDQADATKTLYDRLGSVAAVAREVGISDQTVRNWLAYHNIVPDQVKAMVDANKISVRQARRLAEHVPDVNKAVEIAEEMAKEGRPPRERERILAEAEEDSELPTSVIIQRAVRRKRVRRINFILPPEWDAVLSQASEELTKNRNDIAMDATISWLETSRFRP